MTEEEEKKQEMVKDALEGAAQILLFTMKAIDAPNFITGDIINDADGKKYHLEFRKVE